MDNQLRLPVLGENVGFKERVWKTRFKDVSLDIDDPEAEPQYHNLEWVARLQRHDHIVRKRRGVSGKRPMTEYVVSLTCSYVGEEDREYTEDEELFTVGLAKTDDEARREAARAYARLVAEVHQGIRTAAKKRLKIVRENKPEDLIVCSRCHDGIFAKEVPDYCYSCGARFWEGYIRAVEKHKAEQAVKALGSGV